MGCPTQALIFAQDSKWWHHIGALHSIQRQIYLCHKTTVILWTRFFKKNMKFNQTVANEFLKGHFGHLVIPTQSGLLLSQLNWTLINKVSQKKKTILFPVIWFGMLKMISIWNRRAGWVFKEPFLGNCIPLMRVWESNHSINNQSCIDYRPIN